MPGPACAPTSAIIGPDIVKIVHPRVSVLVPIRRTNYGFPNIKARPRIALTVDLSILEPIDRDYGEN